MPNPFSIVADILGGVVGVVDEIFTNEEEKMVAKSQLLSIQAGVVDKALAAERADLEARTKVLVAEAQAESWITRSWRPITMLTFVVLIVMIAAGWMDMDALERTPDRLWLLLTVGIGGYIGSRGLEKTVPSTVAKVVEALKAREET